MNHPWFIFNVGHPKQSKGQSSFYISPADGIPSSYFMCSKNTLQPPLSVKGKEWNNDVSRDLILQKCCTLWQREPWCHWVCMSPSGLHYVSLVECAASVCLNVYFHPRSLEYDVAWGCCDACWSRRKWRNCSPLTLSMYVMKQHSLHSRVGDGKHIQIKGCFHYKRHCNGHLISV